MSFGESDILKIHIREYDCIQGEFAESDTVEEIGKFEDVFEKITR